MTGNSASNLDSIISELVKHDQPITIAALGGVNALSAEHASSALFPYVADAMVADWHSLDNDERVKPRKLIDLAIRTTPSALALSDICQVVVPAAASLDITVLVKGALRDRVQQRTDQQAVGIASIALRWLTNLAISDDSARGAVVDALSEVSLGAEEPQPFTAVAAQVAGVAYDFWRDPVATACLARLVDNDSGCPDAWFALGQARLADALNAPDRDTCLQGLSTTLECFDFAAGSGEERPDAFMYASAVRFLLAWAAGASATLLANHYRGAREALNRYMLLGYGLPEPPEWTRPRYAAETAWMDLVVAMEQIADRESGESLWYDAGVAIGALADVYRLANCFRPARSNDTSTVATLSDLAAPQLVAPFVEYAERLGYLSRWLRDSDVPGAQDFAALVRERVEQVVRPKVPPPERIRR